MQILFENKNCSSPKVSIILLDWSCRESFHSIDYLNKQTISREQYEIIWIEYYSRIPESLKSKKPLLDKWIVMNMPDDLYYHKHLMYNIGIIYSKGDIICICDSDAVFDSTFVESIIKEFKQSPDIVLHLDEVRNIGKKFYPFNYPSVDEILGSGVINWNKSKSMTTGLLDKNDYLHSRNYGACLCARKTYLITIGGADEKLDYLGHICGPYELTFRLMNYGLKEVWLNNEFIYHTWHPGTDGHLNYTGPNDGLGMSLTALEALYSGRVMPLVENNVIGNMRLLGTSEYNGFLDSVINQDYFEIFKKGNLEGKGFYRLRSNVDNFSIRSFIKSIPVLGSFARWIYRFIKMPHYIKYLIREISDIKAVNHQLLAIITSLNSEISSIKREINKNGTHILVDSENGNKKK